jgi:hypothetical protein
MFPPVFQTLKASNAVKNIVGTNPPRIYDFGKAPQRPDNLPLSDPYITWFAFGTPENQLSGTPPVDRMTVQMDCYHQTSTGCKALATAARDACESVAHMTGMPVNEQETETKLYRIALEFDWFVSRTY